VQDVVGVERQGDAPEHRTKREAHVERRVHVGAGLHAFVSRQHVDRVGAVCRATERADDLHADGHGDVTLEPGDERPHREHRGLTRRADRPHLLGSEAVDELAHREGRQERGDAGDGQAEADLGGGEPDDLGEEDRRTGHERALAQGEEQGLDREPSGQGRRWARVAEDGCESHRKILLPTPTDVA
jgi:hypothetical protein